MILQLEFSESKFFTMWTFSYILANQMILTLPFWTRSLQLFISPNQNLILFILDISFEIVIYTWEFQMKP